MLQAKADPPNFVEPPVKPVPQAVTYMFGVMLPQRCLFVERATLMRHDHSLENYVQVGAKKW